MPRPDKRFIRYPRREPPTEPEAHESSADPDAPRHIQVKGRHMVVPRRSTSPTPAVETSSPAEATRPVPGEGLSKYDRRTGLAAPIAAQSEDADRLDEAVAAAGAEPELEATEVVFDLRESEHGFEGAYWKQPAEERADDTS